jgi:hypothetical protein
MSEQIKTPWGTTGTPGEGVTTAVQPVQPTKLVPDPLIPQDPPFAPSVWLNPEQARANVEYAKLVRADYLYRAAIGNYVRRVYDSKLTEFYTGKKMPAPIFAVSFAVTVDGIAAEEIAALPFDQVAAFYPLPEVK